MLKKLKNFDKGRYFGTLLTIKPNMVKKTRNQNNLTNGLKTHIDEERKKNG